MHGTVEILSQLRGVDVRPDRGYTRMRGKTMKEINRDMILSAATKLDVIADQIYALYQQIDYVRDSLYREIYKDEREQAI